MNTNNLSRWTIFIFGLLAFLLGLAGLRKPKRNRSGAGRDWFNLFAKTRVS